VALGHGGGSSAVLGALVWGVESCGSLGLGNVGVEGGGPQRARGSGGTAHWWRQSSGARRRQPGLGASGGHGEGCGVLGLEMWGRRVELHGELELGQQWRRRRAVWAATRPGAEDSYRPGRGGGHSGCAAQCLAEGHPAVVARKGVDGERRRHWGGVTHGGRRGSRPSGPGRVANARASSGDVKGANPGAGSAETGADCRTQTPAAYGTMRESGRGEIELGLFL